ncbi:hypothetical protein DUI87_27281 [Hirundo rustica rustica]|uniref:Uncharacterized protein n=1 Tax=Hirundo rustica rustica TaxID=333673 RepID=A0A3M0JBP0_HIRRU|nr:hypothetical protein DUI87_27281 [Hirundo rustica rustica]
MVAVAGRCGLPGGRFLLVLPVAAGRQEWQHSGNGGSLWTRSREPESIIINNINATVKSHSMLAVINGAGKLSQRRKEPKTKQQCQCLHKLSQRRKKPKVPSASPHKTVTEAEQPKPVAVAPVQKKKSKSKSVRTGTDEDVAGPSHPAEETEPEIITRSLSLGELRDLRREFTRQTNESILTWLLRIWDAAANDTILDGSEARQLGSCLGMWSLTRGSGEPNKLSASAATANKSGGQNLCKEDLQCTKENGAQWNKVSDAGGTGCAGDLSQKMRDFLKAQMMFQCTSQMC